MIPESPGPPRRSQFLLGPHYLKSESWWRFDLGPSLKLSVQADLEVQQAEGETCRLTLLGFMLNWLQPESSNSDVLNNLAAVSTSLDNCIKETFDLGGRWILIYQDNKEAGIFHDAGGLRQICYAKAAGEELWCASQPDLLAEAAALHPDSIALEFIDAMAERNPEYWWPGNRLPFQNAKILLPNHYLNLDDGRCQRYWPVTVQEHLPMDEVCRRAGDKLKGVIRAAANRFDLALGLSAGWDSRLLLAAAREVRDKLEIYTVQTARQGNRHMDVAVPRKLTHRLGLKHTQIVHRERESSRFSEMFNAHTWRPHSRFAAGVEADFEKYRYSRVAVIGNFSEVAKLPYKMERKQNNVLSGNRLAHLIRMGDQAFAAKALDEWLATINVSSGYQTLDLFYWEQRIGRWLAANCIEYDFGWKDVLVPFNIRSLICDLLACDEHYRNPSGPELYVAIIKLLWSDVLSEPINPRECPTIWQRLQRRMKRMLDIHNQLAS